MRRCFRLYALLLALALALLPACKSDIPDESSLSEGDASFSGLSAESTHESISEPAVPESSVAVQPSEAPDEQPGAQPDKHDYIDSIISGMTLEEKVGQLFLIRCPEIGAVEAVAQYHPGGYVLFARDFKNQTRQSAADNISGYQAQSKLPLLIAVDEEGGTVNRVSLFKNFRAVPFWSPSALYDEGGFKLVESDAKEKAELLSSLGINVNLAPVCDLSHKGSYMFDRSFSPDAQLTSEFVARVVTVSQQNGVGAVLKHFPGYGDNANTHTGIVVDNRSLDELISNDFLPFQAGVSAGAGAILVSHNIISDVDPDSPASLSSAMHELLREKLGFDGVIITDDLSMDAVAEYTGGDISHAAVAAVLAGNDMLCCTDYELQYPALLAAVNSGDITVERIDRSVRRILLWKGKLGLMPQ